MDGNGRVARVMMNADLVKAGHSRIIIPTVYREDYMGALRKLSRQGDTETYIRMLQILNANDVFRSMNISIYLANIYAIS